MIGTDCTGSHGYITIPKSSKPNRIKENMEVYDWSLAEDDMQLLVYYYVIRNNITI
jgi:diketogulonate reductase-like aldo/keto reductase